MITDANGMPVLQPLVDDASTATFNAAFAQIGTVVSGQQIKTYKWANAAARTAQTGMSEGDLGYQRDSKDYYAYDGSSWGLAGSAIRMIGSTTAGVRPISGNVTREGSMVRLYITSPVGSALTPGSVVGTVPSWAIPNQRAMITGFAGANTWSGWVETNGDIQVYGAGVNGYTAGFYMGGTYLVR